MTCTGGVFTDPELIDNTGDSTQSLAVTVTAPFFRVDTNTGNALTITGYGAVSFVDSYAASNLDASGFPTGAALGITSNGDTTGTTVTPGSVTVETSGTLTGYPSISPTAPYYGFGIAAVNFGSGSMSIAANGDVSGAFGILAANDGSSLAVTTGAGSTVAGTYFGIFADNDGTGPLTITTNGAVTGNNLSGCPSTDPCRYGIRASNLGGAMTVTTNAVTTGGDIGIRASNLGSGPLTITVNEDVTGIDRHGIHARSFFANPLYVSTAAGTTVTGGVSAILARNYGSGTTRIITNGDVAGGTSASPYFPYFGVGIAAVNYGTGAVDIRPNAEVSGQFGVLAVNDGSSLSVKTGADSSVTGTYFGIFADNDGTGPLTITTNGPVTGNNLTGCPSSDPCRFGIRASNDGTALTVTTNAVTTGGDVGIRASNIGNGPLTIMANADVTGTDYYGINVLAAYGSPAHVETANGTAVTGGINGVRIRKIFGGKATIIANGDVTGTAGSGIYVESYSSGINAITVTGAVTSEGAGADAFAIETVGSSTRLTVSGTLNGGGGGAVRFDQTSAFADVLRLQPGFEINGVVLAGPGMDTLAFGGSGDGSFNLNKIDAGPNNKQFRSFEMFEVRGGNWSFFGSTAQDFTQTGGTLNNRGRFADVTVNSGTLTGPGAFGNVIVNDGTVNGTGTFAGLTLKGGTLAPGNSIGTMTVNGAFALRPGAVYEVEVNAAGKSDKVSVNGTVNLTGATLKVLAARGNYKTKTNYTIVRNDGSDAVSGTFSTVTTNFAFLTPIVDYRAGDGNDVVLTLMRTVVPNTGGGSGSNKGNPSFLSFCSVAQTKNQCDVALALDKFPFANPLFQAVLTQTADGARQAFDALSGEVHATVAGTLVDDSRYAREAVLGRIVQASHQGGALGSGGPQVAHYDTGAMRLGSKFVGEDMQALPTAQPLAFWTEGYGAWGRFAGDGNAAAATRNLGGFISGMDASIGGSWRVGLATGASFSDVSVDARYSSANTSTYHLGGYVGGEIEGFALRGGGLWAWSEIETSRAVVFPRFYERQTADYNADTGQLFGEIAYPTRAAGVDVEPFAGLAYVSVESGGFREKGGPQASLRSAGIDQDVGYTTVGLRAAKAMMWGNMQVTPHIEATWLHAFDDVTPGALLAFASTGIGFAIDGVPLAEDSALLDAGVDFALSDRLSAGVSYSGQYADTVSDNAVKGRLTWLFN